MDKLFKDHYKKLAEQYPEQADIMFEGIAAIHSAPVPVSKLPTIEELVTAGKISLKKQPSEISKGFKKAGQEMQASAFGAVGLAGSTLGLDSVRDYGYEGYKRNMKEAEEYHPRVGLVEDIDSVGSGFDWLMSSVGSLGPSVIEAGLSALAGSVAGSAVPGPGTAMGAIAGLTSKKAIREAIEAAVKKRVAKEVAEGATESVARESAERAVVSSIKRAAGAKAGIIAGVSPMEGGQMFGAAADDVGVENVQPGVIIPMALLSSISEIAGPEGRLIRKVGGKNVLEEAVKKTRKEALRGAIAEGAGESGQEMLQTGFSDVSKLAHNPNATISGSDYWNAGAVGFVGGQVFNAPNIVFGAKGLKDPHEKDLLKPEAEKRTIEINEAGIKPEEIDSYQDRFGTTSPAKTSAETFEQNFAEEERLRRSPTGRDKLKAQLAEENLVAPVGEMIGGLFNKPDLTGSGHDVLSGAPTGNEMVLKPEAGKGLAEPSVPASFDQINAEMGAVSPGINPADSVPTSSAIPAIVTSIPATQAGPRKPFMDFVEKKVAELGSPEAINSFYSGNSAVDQYAKQYANEFYNLPPATVPAGPSAAGGLAVEDEYGGMGLPSSPVETANINPSATAPGVSAIGPDGLKYTFTVGNKGPSTVSSHDPNTGEQIESVSFTGQEAGQAFFNNIVVEKPAEKPSTDLSGNVPGIPAEMGGLSVQDEYGGMGLPSPVGTAPMGAPGLVLPEERRVDDERRKTVSEMTPDEMRRELLTDDLTGLGNKRAYRESEKKKVQSVIDVDSLKYVNDEFGHEAGDALLVKIGEALKQEGLDAYHVSGDEYYLQSETDVDIDTAVQRAYDYLKDSPLEFNLSDGSKVVLKGSFSYGKGTSIKEADAKLQQHKSDRELSGDRAARGEEPPGIVRVPASGIDNNRRENVSTESKTSVTPAATSTEKDKTPSVEIPEGVNVTPSGKPLTFEGAKRSAESHYRKTGKAVEIVNLGGDNYGWRVVVDKTVKNDKQDSLPLKFKTELDGTIDENRPLSKYRSEAKKAIKQKVENLREQIGVWKSKVYKKNDTIITVNTDDGGFNSRTKRITIGEADENKRKAKISSFLEEIKDLDTIYPLINTGDDIQLERQEAHYIYYALTGKDVLQYGQEFIDRLMDGANEKPGPSQKPGVKPDQTAGVKEGFDPLAVLGVEKENNTPDASEPSAPSWVTSKKEPWELTSREYLETIRVNRNQNVKKSGLIQTGGKILSEGTKISGIPVDEVPGWENKIGEHRELIKGALDEGKKVPESVLADYPDLIQKPVEPAKKEEPDELIGKNSDGNPVYRGKNGNRYFLQDGKYKVKAPVPVNLSRDTGVTESVKSAKDLYNDGRYGFLTAQEVFLFEKTEGKEEAPKPATDFEVMVKDAAKWRGAAKKVSAGLAGRDALRHSNETTKGDLDAYLMKKYGLSQTEARDVSNTLTSRNVPDDMSANIDDFKDEPWYRAPKPKSTVESESGLIQDFIDGKTEKPPTMEAVEKEMAEKKKAPGPKAFTDKELDGITVTVMGILPNGKPGEYQESAKVALEDIDYEISLYEKIRDCIG